MFQVIRLCLIAYSDVMGLGVLSIFFKEERRGCTFSVSSVPLPFTVLSLWRG